MLMVIKKDHQRRQQHNEVERRRRDKINTWINKISKVVPDCSDDHTKQGQVKLKVHIFTKFLKNVRNEPFFPKMNSLEWNYIKLSIIFYFLLENWRNDSVETFCLKSSF